MRKMLFLLCLIFVPSEGLQVKKGVSSSNRLAIVSSMLDTMLESDTFKVATRDGAGEGQKGGG